MASASDSDQVVKKIVAALDASGTPYMFTGSVASSFHGISRSTYDMDIVIWPTESTLSKFLDQFENERVSVNRLTAMNALRSRSLFNLIDHDTGWKFDFIISKPGPFHSEQYKRRRRVDLFGTNLFIASPEDVIVSKLDWAKMSESERQLQDVSGILKRLKDRLDLAYVEHWVEELKLQVQYEKAKSILN